MSTTLFDEWPTGSQWDEVLRHSLRDPQFRKLDAFIAGQRDSHTVYPRFGDVFRAFHETPFEKVRVVILGQDPYHGIGQAHGLSFSVPVGIPHPPSLRNIFKELVDDIGCEMLTSGNLTAWAQQGVLLLNTILTVEEGKPLSHAGRGWEWFTDSVIAALAESERSLIFVLWGKPAQLKAHRLLNSRHQLIIAPHPSPLSAYRGFFGSRPFSTINRFLIEQGSSSIDWSLTTTGFQTDLFSR
jgi:uracil-DNA glycosylase